ncbi:PREDICTED: antigen KI-67 [Chinchilla lanigera]|uniref:antigen KI-67 n=1 Tax=Chinchilla lanigera TaxID=34839 RepID=UPI0006988EA7|nr:PREDICTED: antigen KI-67 [Chinchilla lanigera]
MGPTARLVTIKRNGVDGIPFPLTLSTCLFGRGTECDIRIQLPVVSKQHCKIEINRQEAILYNFSSTNPTQVNGSAIDKPVLLRHGDIITIIDRSFRYENESYQNRSQSPELPEKICEQKPARRASRASFSADPDDKDQDSKAHSSITEGHATGGSLVHGKQLKQDSSTSDGSKGSAAQEPVKVPSSEPPRHGNRNAGDPTIGDFKEKSRVTSVGCYGELKTFPTTQFLDNGNKSESPFKKLYQSMKEEFDVKSQRQNVLQYRRKSGSSTAYTPEKGSADSSQKEAQLLVSCKSRPKSNRSTHVNGASSPAPEMSQAKGKKSDPEPIQTSEEAVRSSLSLSQVTKVQTPVRHSQQKRSSQKRKSEDLHVTDREESLILDKNEDVSLKRRRVSFGSHLRPELFDENLPPNTPLKRGETPAKRKSLGTHTPAVLKKIIKEQPQSSGKEESPEICLEVKAQHVSIDALAPSPRVTPPRTNDQRRRSHKGSTASGDGKSPDETDMPKKSGKKSGHLPAKRASISRSQHDILQMISSKRRSGASEANLIVAKSWADVVKLGVKQTQTKVVKHPPPRQMSKRQRRPSTPKKPSDNVHNQFSTGHANSPCTIVIGKAQIEKVNAPAQPYRMLNNFVFTQKVDYNEDLSGLTEMFKTPVKEKPQMMSTHSVTPSSSENLLGDKSTVISSGEESLSIPSVNLGENVYSSAQSAAKEPSDKCFASPILRRKCIKEDEKIVKTPRNIHKITHFEIKTPDSATEALKTVYSTNKLRSVELRKVQILPIESTNEELATGITENITRKNLRKTPLREKEKDREMKDSERSLETCKENVELNENSGKGTPVRRSRSSGKKCESTSDLTDLRRTPGKEPTEHISGPQMPLQKTDCAKELTNEVGTTTKMPCTSSQPEPIHSPASRKRQLKIPLGKVDVKEEVTALRSLSQMSGEHIHIVNYDKSMDVLKETPKQKLDSAMNATRMKRLPRTPKNQPLEDLAGIKELLQTPEHKDVPISEYKAKVLYSSPQTEAVDTPRRKKTFPNTPQRKVDIKEEKAIYNPKATEGEDKGIKALNESVKQTLDLATNISCSKRRPTTPKAKAQPLEDLAGFQELFQTPGPAKDPMTESDTTKTPHGSSQSEPVESSTASKRRSKISLGKMDGEEGLRLTQSPSRAMHTPTVPIQEKKSIRASLPTPKQKLHLTESLTEPKRPARTPKANMQPLDDLAGFQALFQTPGCAKDSVTEPDTSKTPCGPSQSGPVESSTASKRCSKISLGKIDGEEGLSKPRRLTQSPSRAMHTPTIPVQEKRGIRASLPTPKQKLDLTESLTEPKRPARTPKAKAQPVEDLDGFQELFQTPGHAKDSVTEQDTAKTPHGSSQSAPVHTSTASKRRSKISLGKMDGEEGLSTPRRLTQSPSRAMRTPTEPIQKRGIRASVPTSEQKLDLTESLTEPKRSAQTPKANVQPLEDLAGFQELFQTPGCTKDRVASEKTPRLLCRSPQLGLVDSPTSKRCRKTSLGKVDVREPSLERELTQMSEKTMSTSKMKVDGGDKSLCCETSAGQTLDLATKESGGRRQRRTTKVKAELLEDLTGFQELFQTPGDAKDPMTVDKTTKMPYTSLHPGLLRTSPTLNRCPRTSLGAVDMREELSAPMKLIQSPGKALHIPLVPVQKEKSVRISAETPVQKLNPRENLSGLKRQPRTPKAKAHVLEDLTGFQKLFQTPDPANHPVTLGETPEMPCISLQAESVDTPAKVVRWSTSLEGKNVKNHLAVINVTQISGKIAHTYEEPTDDKESQMFKKSSKRKLDTAESVTGNKRLRGESKKNSQSLEDLTGFKELFQTPGHTEESVSDEQTTKMPCKSEPESVDSPRRKKALPSIPRGKRDMKEKQIIHTPKATEDDDKGIQAFKESAKQTLDLATNVSGSRRWPRTPEIKAQVLEDLTTFRELFQTPDYAEEPIASDEITKMPCISLQPGPLYTPTTSKRHSKASLGKTDGKKELPSLKRQMQSPGRAMHTPSVLVQEQGGVRASTETPNQKLHPGENLKGLKRQPRTPKAKAHILEDLTGFRELFQTPDHANGPITENLTGPGKQPRTPKTKAQPLEDLSGLQELFQTPGCHSRSPLPEHETHKTPCRSPQSPPIDTAISSRRHSKISLGKIDMKEELSSLRKLTQSPGKTMHTPLVPVQEQKRIRVSTGTPEQQLALTENLNGLKRRPQTPKTKAQPLEDLAGFQELFQTPNHAKDLVTTVKTPHRSQSTPVGTVTTSKRCPKKHIGKGDVKAELSAVRERTLKDTMHTLKEAIDDKHKKVFKESAKRKLNPAESVTGTKRLRRAPKEKTQTLDDLCGLQELFQTPGYTEESVSDEKATVMSCKSPQSESVGTLTKTRRGPRTRLRKVNVKEDSSAVRKSTRTSKAITHTSKVPEDDDKGIKPLKEIEQKTLDLAAGVSGSRRWPRAAKAKAQPIQDTSSSKKLSQTSGHTEESVRDEKTTKTPCKSPQQVPGDTSAASKRRPRTRFGKVDVTEELSTQRKQRATSGETMNTHKEPPSDSKGSKEFKESAKRKRDHKENITGSKRLRGTHKKMTQLLEDLASSKELIQKPTYTEESLSNEKTTKMPCKSSQPEPADTPVSTKRQLRTRLGNVNVKEGLSVVRKPTRMSRATTRTSKMPEGDDKDIKAFKEPSEQTLNPAISVTSTRRNVRASKAKSQVEDLSSPKERIQTPDHTVEQMNDVHNPKSTPQQIPDSIKPLKTSRRVLRVPKEKPIEDLVDTKGPAASQNGMSLRTRHQNKTDTNQQNLEIPTSEKAKIKRREKKSMKTSEEIEQQIPGDGAGKPTFKGKVSGNRVCLRSGRQNKNSQLHIAEEDVKENSMDIPVKNQKEKEVTNNSVTVSLRSKRAGIQPKGNTLESDSEQRITQGTKRCTENPKKDKDIMDTKKIRTRSHRNIENI